MELLEYLIRLRGAEVASAEVQGLRRQFQELSATARDTAAKAEAAAGETAGTGRSIGIGAGMAKIAKVGALGIVGIGLAAVKMSNTFQTEMLKIRTEGGATGKEFDRMRQGVLNLALSGQSMGQGPTSLAQGLYHLESMGIRGRKALEGLKLASEEAAISGASLQDTTTSLGGALFIAAKGTGTLHQVMGALNAIAGSGNMRFQELNDALGQGLLGSAKIAGVSLQETGAALAVLTDSGYKASSAGAQLATALHYLYAPTSKAEKALSSIHLTGRRLAEDLRKPQGILAALRDLRGHMQGLNAGQQANVLNDILPGGRGRVLLNLYQLQNRLAPKYDQILGTSGDFTQHVTEQQRNPGTRLAEGWARLQATLVKLGDALKKYVNPLLITLEHAAATFVLVLIKALPLLKTLLTIMLPLAAAFVAYKAAVIAAGIAQAVMAGAGSIAAFIALAGSVTSVRDAMLLLNLAFDANPIGLIVGALAALVTGFIIAYHHVKWFRDAVDAVWSWLRGAATHTVDWVIGAFKDMVHWLSGVPGSILGFFKGLGNGIVGVFKDALNWIIKQLNHFIDSYNSIAGSVPFLGGSLTIGHIGLIGGGPGNQANTHPRPLSKRQVAQIGVPKGHHQGMPAVVYGDIVLKVNERELGRVTRRQLHEAMMG